MSAANSSGVSILRFDEKERQGGKLTLTFCTLDKSRYRMQTQWPKLSSIRSCSNRKRWIACQCSRIVTSYLLLLLLIWSKHFLVPLAQITQQNLLHVQLYVRRGCYNDALQLLIQFHIFISRDFHSFSVNQRQSAPSAPQHLNPREPEMPFWRRRWVQDQPCPSLCKLLDVIILGYGQLGRKPEQHIDIVLVKMVLQAYW